jgi:hypothetical protein
MTITQARSIANLRRLRQANHDKQETEESLAELNKAKSLEEAAWQQYWDGRIKEMKAVNAAKTTTTTTTTNGPVKPTN